MLGWIKIHRSMTENEFYFSERFTKMQAWLDLCILANHKPATIFIRGNEITLKRGQLGYSIKNLAKRWKWNERTVAKYLEMLSKREMIHYRKSKITTIISILNYDLYQSNTEQNTEQNTSRVHTDKNDKNDKNEIRNNCLIPNGNQTPNEVTDEFIKIVEHYKQTYLKYMNEEHPYVRAEQMSKIYDVINDNIDYGVDVFNEMIDLHLETKYSGKCDYNMNHFFTKGIIEIKLNETNRSNYVKKLEAKPRLKELMDTNSQWKDIQK